MNASVLQTYWRCDSCGEGFVVSTAPVLLDEEGEVLGLAPVGVDYVIQGVPCQICGEDCRRVVGPYDHRDWAAQIG